MYMAFGAAVAAWSMANGGVRMLSTSANKLWEWNAVRPEAEKGNIQAIADMVSRRLKEKKFESAVGWYARLVVRVAQDANCSQSQRVRSRALPAYQNQFSASLCNLAAMQQIAVDTAYGMFSAKFGKAIVWAGVLLEDNQLSANPEVNLAGLRASLNGNFDMQPSFDMTKVAANRRDALARIKSQGWEASPWSVGELKL